MKAHHLSITTLEEHEPNREFIGRNFNNGEIIQLVLRSKNGGWLPFNMVQMVMMHELAHNTHMNHGKKFWDVRNAYTGELRGLWGKGYTGEGFWGSGRRLADMHSVMGNNIVDAEVLRDLPVCGGTYRSRRRKRKAKQELTWKEKRDRRIEKKFGKNGLSLGEDEDKRMLLELGKKGPIGGKPRVAQSNRGRELRAAAALARFDTNKKEVDDLKKEEEVKEEESSDLEDYEDLDAGVDDARDTDGHRLLDSKGNAMVRVCGEGDQDQAADEVHVKQEMEELEGLERYFPRLNPDKATSNGEESPLTTESRDAATSPSDTQSEDKVSIPTKDTKSVVSSSLGATSRTTTNSKPQTNGALEAPSSHRPARTNTETPVHPQKATHEVPSELICPICSLSNPSLLLTCSACANVLHPTRDKKHWSCASEQCKPLGYINAGDVGLCGLCGQGRP